VNYSSVWRFEPAGLEFLLPVEVRIPYDGAEEYYWMFWSNSSESEYESIDYTLDEFGRAIGYITHFSTGFVGSLQTQIDTFDGVEAPLLDVLFVIDNSCSMYEEQTALTTNFDAMLESVVNLNVDWHIGVVSTDMADTSHRGKLRTANGVRYIDPTVSDPVSTFRSMAQMGTSGSYNEQGRAAAYSALEILKDSYNLGFYREGAHLAIVVLSDENDYSGANPSLTDFITWLLNLKATSDMVSFSSIVGPIGSCSTAAEEGTDYIAVTAAVGGVLWSICSSDYSVALEQVVDEAVEISGVFYLSQTPVQRTIIVTVTEAAGTVVELDTTMYVYNAGLNAVGIYNEMYALSDDSVVEISYTPLPI
jgi:hypothetical protein